MFCEREGLALGTVGKWLESYGRKDKKQRRSPAEKSTIIREILSGRSTISDVQLKYRLNCRDTITKWIREYKKAQPELPSDSPEAVATEQNAEVAELQKELEMARLKIRALEIVVDIASDQFKVDIRKKFGAKQCPSSPLKNRALALRCYVHCLAKAAMPGMIAITE